MRSKVRSRFAVGAIAAALLLAVAVAAVGRGNWLHQVASMSALLWIGAPALLLGAFAAVRRWTRIAIVCFCLLGALGLQLPLGAAFSRWDVAAGKQYCEELIPILDAIYGEDGAYPRSLDADERLNVSEPLMVKLGGVFYASDGETFSLEVYDPAELFGGLVYSSVDRSWTEWRD